jgi:hypothetical protein
MNAQPDRPLATFPLKHGQCLFSDKRHKVMFGGRCGLKSTTAAIEPG